MTQAALARKILQLVASYITVSMCSIHTNCAWNTGCAYLTQTARTYKRDAFSSKYTSIPYTFVINRDWRPGCKSLNDYHIHPSEQV